MNCSDWEHQIADESQSPALDAHLRRCAGCQEYLREIAANRVALGALAVDPVALDAVRMRVLGEIRSKSQRRIGWLWPAAAAACLAMLFAWMVAPRFQNPAPPLPVEFAKAPKLSKWKVQPVRRAVPVRRNAEPLVVKMLTNDPDVIVVWLVDQKGDAI